MLSKKIDIVESALLDRFLRIPYKHQGRALDGADCWGGIILWYRLRLGIELLDIGEDYPPDWKFKGKHYFVENYHEQWTRVDIPMKYDVILFKVGPEVNHAGIYLKDGKFYNINKAGGVINRLDVPGWKDRIEGFYRYKGLNENNN